MQESEFKFSPSVLLWPLYFVLSLWFVFWIEVQFKVSLNNFGIFPRSFYGLRGVVFSPFLHTDIEHLFNNSIPLLFLIAALRYFYRKVSFEILVYGIICSGLGTWLIGRANYHIGASGLIYVLASFIFFKGIQTRYFRLVALSFTIVLVYGGMVWYMFPNEELEISWEGHLSGFVVGFVFSILYKSTEHHKQITYEWQKPDFDASKDPFLKHFDEQGNFISSSKMRALEEEKWQYFISNLPVIYTYKETDK